MKKTLAIIFAATYLFGPVNGYAVSLEEKINGLYAKGSCQDPEYMYYVSNNNYFYIFSAGARFARPISLRETDNYIIQQWKNNNANSSIYGISYVWLEKGDYFFASKTFPEEQHLELYADEPPSDWRVEKRVKCQNVPIVKMNMILHSEALSFLKSTDDLPSKCGNIDVECFRYVFSIFEVVKDAELSRAELSRLIRIMSYFAVVSRDSVTSNDNISGTIGITTLIAPIIATSLIEGSDYDGDGKLGLDELMYDRDPEQVAASLGAMSYRTMVDMLAKMFGAIPFLR